MFTLVLSFSLVLGNLAGVTVAAVSGELDPQSRKFLELLIPEEISPVKAASGSSISLWEAVAPPENPDFDPVEYVETISIKWEQKSGPAATLENVTTRDARVLMPQVKELSFLVFEVTATNKSGTRKGELKVTVYPPAKP
jgi:hypothetical protein